MTFTDNTAVAAFFAVREDEPDEIEIAAAVANIGDPDVELPVTRTSETIDHFLASGWTMDATDVEGLACIKRVAGTHRTARGTSEYYDHAWIADCGDYRLVYVERG